VAKREMGELRQIALEAIRKKLVGKRLSYKEYYAIIDEIARGGVGDVVTAYFAAVGFTRGFTNQELFFLTKAMVETGDKLRFGGIVADKHSVGGVAGCRTTLILVPIVAAAGLKIPKTSSRAITSPAGTADVMDILAKVSFPPGKIKEIVNKVGGCIAWGGTVHLAPSEDEIIEVERTISFESYDKVVAAVMAKKIAAGATHLVIDIPYGRDAKVKSRADAEYLERKFVYIAHKFNIKILVEKALINWPISQGIGPVLEARDCLRVLQQKANRPLGLEARALKLASSLLRLCGKNKELAKELLVSGRAFEKMKEIIKAQGGDSDLESEDLKPGKRRKGIESEKEGIVKEVENKNISRLCRILGAPKDKKAGVYLEKKRSEKVKKGELLFSMFSSDKMRMEKAREELKINLEIYRIEPDV
jgi:putative thymidine phosphorylase